MIWQDLIQNIATVMGTDITTAGAFVSLILIASIILATLILSKDLMPMCVMGAIGSILFGLIGWLNPIYCVGFLLIFSIVGAVVARNMGGRGEA